MNYIECESAAAPLHLVPSREEPARTFKDVAMLRPLPSSAAGLPCNYEPPFRRAVPTTPADRVGALVDCPHTCGLPQMTGGSASALELSRPARASLCYGPSDRSAAQGPPLSQDCDPASYPPCRLPASGPIDYYPGETLPH
jgi:hypothetical protein